MAAAERTGLAPGSARSGRWALRGSSPSAEARAARPLCVDLVLVRPRSWRPRSRYPVRPWSCRRRSRFPAKPSAPEGSSGRGGSAAPRRSPPAPEAEVRRHRCRHRRKAGAQFLIGIFRIRTIADQALCKLLAFGRGQRAIGRWRHRGKVWIIGRLPSGEILGVGCRFRIGVVLAGASPITPSVDGVACAEPEHQCQDGEPTHRASGEMGYACHHDRIPDDTAGCRAGTRPPAAAHSRGIDVLDPFPRVTTFDDVMATLLVSEGLCTPL